MSASEVLQHLYSLNTSSPDFLRVLYGLVRYDEDEHYSSGLEGEELARLVDFLDKALGAIPTTDDVFRQCLRKLRAICGYHATLPSSHIISGDLTKAGEGPIAFGGFADVWKGTHGGRRVCIKVLRVSLNDDESLTKSFFKEAVVWKRLRHPNVVPFLGVTISPLQFVSEWMPNGTLTRYVKKNTGADRIALLLDVAEGLNYLHMSHTIHGDLKGPNILIDHNGHARLTDFGLASIVHGINSVPITHPKGYTTRWTAPEILKGADEITREADIFSFGMVVIEVFTGRHPFSDLNSPSAGMAVIVKIMEGERPTRPRGTRELELGLVDPIWDMAVNCWQHDPAHRPTMVAVVGFLRECYTLRAANKPLSALGPWQPTGSTANVAIHAATSPIPTDGNPNPTSQSSRTSRNSSRPQVQTHEISATPSSTFNINFPGTSHSSGGSSSEPPPDEPRRFSNSASHGHDLWMSNVVSDRNMQHENDNRTSTQRDINGPRQPVRSATFDEPKTTPILHELFRTTSLPMPKERHPPFGSDSNHKAGVASSKNRSGKKEKRSQKTGKALWHVIAAAVRFTVFAKRKPAENRSSR